MQNLVSFPHFYKYYLLIPIWQLCNLHFSFIPIRHQENPTADCHFLVVKICKTKKITAVISTRRKEKNCCVFSK